MAKVIRKVPNLFMRGNWVVGLDCGHLMSWNGVDAPPDEMECFHCANPAPERPLLFWLDDTPTETVEANLPSLDEYCRQAREGLQRAKDRAQSNLD